MRLMLYSSGGDFAEQLVGSAHDFIAPLNLIQFLWLSGANACSVHDSLGYGSEPLSGEMGLGSLENLLGLALAA